MKVANTYKRVIFLTICILVGLVALLGIRQFLKSKNIETNASIQNLQNQNSSAKQYSEQLTWIVYNQQYDQTQISMEIPFPGPYCDCFDSTGGLSGVSLNQVEGGFFTNQDSPSTRHWLIVSGLFTPGHFFQTMTWGVPIGNFYSQLSQIGIEKQGTFTDEKGVKTVVVHLQNKIIDGTTFFIFKTDLNVSNFGQMSREFAIFKHRSDVGYISFEYDRKLTLYSEVFDHMLQTFSFSKKGGTTYEQEKANLLR
ncbi:hypothetical protein C5B42_04420 [Candidatus Cerribacteria bacterium 'Amazon FNV 2010 28 9']|uniref:Uncharacterized protein n=1 Tax=Candidatus Cerribacteria bacterium 'Amazon FNV 2010 28 9' TaxID=2081795 RepID=A0A317JMX0_9BACT|nr:MAG: hypothetical protein C5B42_04420 [Candidatus Cerribacteria bacterium 'Amazon FNV 2010 28 9']